MSSNGHWVAMSETQPWKFFALQRLNFQSLKLNFQFLEANFKISEPCAVWQPGYRLPPAFVARQSRQYRNNAWYCAKNNRDCARTGLLCSPFRSDSVAFLLWARAPSVRALGRGTALSPS